MYPEQVIPPLVVPSDVWVKLFVLVSYALFLGCMYHAIKMGIVEYRQSQDRGDSHWGLFFAAITPVGFLSFFVVGYWFVESIAHNFTPYFVYSLGFPAPVGLAWDPDSLGTVCPEFVRCVVEGETRYKSIPFSVLMMEASLTYAAMWTALMLNKGREPKYLLVPIWASLFVVILDLLLDPVVGATYACTAADKYTSSDTCETILRITRLEPGSGIGLWHWFLPGGPSRSLAHWFGVPLFNYAAWLAGPVIMISAAMAWLHLWRRSLRKRRNARRKKRNAAGAKVRQLAIVETAPESPLFGLTAAGVLVILVVLMFAPNSWTGPLWLQQIVLAGLLLGAAYFVVRRVPSFETNNRPDPNLTLPPLVFIGLPALALFIEGVFLEEAGFIFAGLISFVLVVLFTFWPYQKLVRRLARRLIDLDRFTRIAYFGFSAMMVLLGAFAVGLEREVTLAPEGEDAIQKWHVGGLLTVALAFHVFAYVSNDLIDLDIDVGQPKRKRDPLVRHVLHSGRTGIPKTTALAIAAVQLPIAAFATFLLDATYLAYAVLGGGFLLMIAYNIFGKWCADPKGCRRRLFPGTKKNAPPITDFIQALAWGSLALFGALIIDPEWKSNNWILVWAVFSFGAGFILLINGIHGGLRDLKNDEEMGCETTAIWLGAKEENGVVLSNWKIQALAFTIHTLMFALPLWAAANPEVLSLTALERIEVVGILVVCFTISMGFLREVVRKHQPNRDGFTSLHAIVILQTPLFAFRPFVGLTMCFILFACFWGPLLTNKRTLKPILHFTHPKLKLSAD